MTRAAARLVVVLLLWSAPLLAQGGGSRGDTLTDAPDSYTQVQQLQHAMTRLPVAAGLACLLALRPRRRGTPHRQAPVIQTQIILAVVGAVVMLVVGSSLARAFGIVGAAGLVRYRAKIEDPKDAGVMLSTLAIGLAAGVGLWPLAAFATLFVLALLWIVESFEPTATQLFLLTVKTSDPQAFKPKLDDLLRRHRLQHELRTTGKAEVCYDVHVPLDRRTDRLSDQILGLDQEAEVKWEEKKEKK
ncbi:MAG TPA: DUF4956 domain-containing protein [Vicinamibacterales bacterium]|jgi:hypothetical protein|nr:DUF4956 domain-containing protein [Vicinamibacterales bacterium]